MSGDDSEKVAQAPPPVRRVDAGEKPAPPVRFPLGLALPTAVFLAVLAWGSWQVLVAARLPGETPLPASWEDVRTGRSFAAFEKRLEHNLPAREDLIAFAQITRYALTGSAGEQVRVGRDGWLFLTDELRHYPEAARNQAARLRLIAATQQALARRGVDLVVALVPDKARVYEKRLDNGRLPAHVRGRYAAALADLRGMGVPVADLYTPLRAAAGRGEVYYRSDTHWNQTGARIAAEAVATEVRALGHAVNVAKRHDRPPLPLGEGRGEGDGHGDGRRPSSMSASIAMSVNWEPAQFETDAAGPETDRPGDLIRLMGLERAPAWLRPRPDREAPEQTRRLDGDGGGLFGDTQVPVVLAGTSYGLRGNFHGRLQQALAAEVLNTAKDGGGFLTAMTEYLNDEAFRTAPPEVLVWEVPERLLPIPLEGEEGWLGRVGLEEAADPAPSAPL